MLLIISALAAIGFSSLLVTAAWLMWHQGRSEAHEALGRPLFTGAVVGLILALLQFSTQLELQTQNRAAQAQQSSLAAQAAGLNQAHQNRFELVTQINLRRDLRDIDLHGQDLSDLYLARKGLSRNKVKG